jgi:hypothetical protein
LPGPCSISILSPFLLLPHLPLSGRVVSQYIPPVLVGVLIFGVAPLLMFFRAVRYKRALFNPPSPNSGRPDIYAGVLTRYITRYMNELKSATNVNTDWDVYKLERKAFATVAVPEQREWESRQTILWLIGAIYLAAIAIPLGYAFPMPTLILLGASAALFAVVKTYRWQRRVHALQASRGPAQAS